MDDNRTYNMAIHHSHSHAGHDHVRDHAGGPRTPHRALVWALVITGAMGLLEAVGAFWSGSLALLSDAGHMATDAAALGLALFASRIAHRPRSEERRVGKSVEPGGRPTIKKRR